MTHDRLSACLDILGWSQRHLADRLDIQVGRVRRWASPPGRRHTPVPPAVAEWIERRVEAVEKDPRPIGWAA